MSKQDYDFQKKLDNLSCPFTWNIDKAITSYYSIQKFERKVEDDGLECSTLLYNIINLLMASYEEMRKDNMEKSEKNLKEAAQYLKDTKQLNLKELEGTMRSVEHVLDATKCHILYKQENVKEAEKILMNLVTMSCMTTKELGALDGIQSIAWSLYNEFGKEKAVEFARNAVRLNPENSLWHFILAKSLRLCRRMMSVSTRPEETERKSFEKAYEISKDPFYGVYVAQMLRESMHSLKNYSAWQKKEDEIKILGMYKEILQSDDLPSYIILRITLGLIRMNMINTQDLAEQCLNMFEKKSEGSSFYKIYLHYKALYLEKFEPSNIIERLKYLKAAGELNNFPADMSYAECGISVGLDPIEHLQKMLTKYAEGTNEMKQNMLLAIATSYYMEKDIKNAAEYYLKALEVDPNAPKLKGFYKFSSFNTKWTKSIYGFLMRKFLPELRAASDASLKDMHLKIMQICQQYMHGDTTSLDDHVKNLKL